jgi:hypothetical protein
LKRTDTLADFSLIDRVIVQGVGRQAHHTLLDNGINHLIPLLGWQIIAIDLPNQTAK